MPNKTKIPAFKPGRQAGYDVQRKRYYTIDGKPISKSQFESGHTDGVHGGWINGRSFAPGSTLMGKLERIVSRAEKGEDLSNDPLLAEMGGRFNRIMAATQPYMPAQTRPIPAEVRASMRLADYYTRASGDIWAHIEAPIIIAAGGELEYQSPDSGFAAALKAEYDRLDMHTILTRAWMGAAHYGISFPYEVYDNKKRLLQVIDLPPSYVWVGYMVPYGLAPRSVITGPEADKQENINYALLPFNDAQQWTADLADSSIMPMTFNSGGVPQNMNLPWGYNIPLYNQNLNPVRAMSYGYERYPVVPISRAFVNMGTRAVFDETVRGTIEGRQNELWVFTLGTEKSMPKGEEIIALQNTLSGMAGERTGRLVWRHGLDVKLYAPTEMQNMLAAETRQSFTLEIFRQLGGNIRIETGNPLIGQRETAADKVDLAMWLRRIEYPRRQVLAWEQYIRSKIADTMGTAAKKANPLTSVKWAQSVLETSSIIEMEVQPLYSIGLGSRRSMLKRAGYSYEQERDNKQTEAADAELFAPPATFAQNTVGPGGEQKQIMSPQSPGRPKGNADMMAAWQDDSLRGEMMSAMAGAVLTQSTQAFIDQVRTVNSTYMARITKASYLATGGTCEPLPEELGFAGAYNNAHTLSFEQDLLAAGEGGDLSKFGPRAMLHATEGYKMAVLNGQRLAMRERGAKSWSRVVSADSCPKCKLDASMAHSIDEPFTLMHVGERLEEEELGLRYHTSGGISSVHVPVPSYTNEAIETLKSVTGSKSHTTRRARD